MKTVTALIIAAMLILHTRISAQVTEGYIPANLGRIVEVATPNGVLSRPHVLIGWDTNGFVKQANSQNTYKIFGSSPYSTGLKTSGFNSGGRFGAPSGHDCIEIRFGDSSRYWIGNNLAPNKVPFSVYNVGPKAADNPSISGGIKLCLQVTDDYGNGLYNPGEMISIYGDMSLPLDSTYNELSSLSSFPFTNYQRYISYLRFGKSSIPYTQEWFSIPTDGILPPYGTVIRFLAASADSSIPFINYFSFQVDTGIQTYDLPGVKYQYPYLDPFYSFEKPHFQLVQAPPRMTIDTNGVITWITYAHQVGKTYNCILKLSNSEGETITNFTASIKGLPSDTGIVEYKAETSGNLIRFWQRNDGSIGFRASQSMFGMEYPIGSNYSIIYAGGFQFGGKKPGLASAPDTMNVAQCEFQSEMQPGRILNTGPFGSLQSEDYHNNQTFYTLPENSHSWPLDAPHNGSGLPLQLSGRDTWTVFNDLSISKVIDLYSYSPGFGLEVQRQTFQFNHYPFNNAMIVRYSFINKSDKTYDSCYVGFFDDSDVGANSGDDLGQLDSALSLKITYSNPAGNDLHHSALGVQILQGPMADGNTGDTASMMTLGGEGFKQFILSEKKVWLATSGYFYFKSMEEPDGRGYGDMTRYWYLQGLDYTGNPKPGGPFYPGQASASRRDQRGYLSSGPFTFAAGDTQEIWMAFIGGMGVDNASAVDTVRDYARRILDDFKNNRICSGDNLPLDISLYGLSTQAVNRIRFIANVNKPVSSLIIRAGNDTLNVQPLKESYFADYDINKTGNIELLVTGKDLSGKTDTVRKSYLISAMNKPLQSGPYRFSGQGEGYMLVSQLEPMVVPLGWIRMGEPMEVLRTSGSDVGVEYTMTSNEMDKIKSKYPELIDEHIGLYYWNGTKWEETGSRIQGNTVKGIVKGSRIAVFYNPDADQSPMKFALEPNYPNPFNPSTTIRYELKQSSKVSLKVYNILGQEVRTLVNKQQPNGGYSVIWDGKNEHGQMVGSGVYFYRLQAGDFVKTRKMVLVK